MIFEETNNKWDDVINTRTRDFYCVIKNIDGRKQYCSKLFYNKIKCIKKLCNLADCHLQHINNGLFRVMDDKHNRVLCGGIGGTLLIVCERTAEREIQRKYWKKEKKKKGRKNGN